MGGALILSQNVMALSKNVAHIQRCGHQAARTGPEQLGRNLSLGTFHLEANLSSDDAFHCQLSTLSTDTSVSRARPASPPWPWPAGDVGRWVCVNQTTYHLLWAWGEEATK